MDVCTSGQDGGRQCYCNCNEDGNGYTVWEKDVVDELEVFFECPKLGRRNDLWDAGFNGVWRIPPASLKTIVGIVVRAQL